ncbi:hypothetical protein JTE90_018848 [Oedothorax gibbosus]|uniref:Uncharacterized protein n=1 Tax=Oedothorax gibbosus TaxID=931172 RepID=A0AAV6UV93_9ARAC|nr:hypothetical protein JTE90_018848 [Oedothorax gibbosus]
MPRATRAYKKRKGFNFSGRKSNEIVIEGSTAAIPAPLVEAPVSSSSKKLGDLNSSYSGIHDNLPKNIIVDVDLLSFALEKCICERSLLLFYGREDISCNPIGQQGFGAIKTRTSSGRSDPMPPRLSNPGAHRAGTELPPLRSPSHSSLRLFGWENGGVFAYVLLGMRWNGLFWYIIES